MSAYWYVKGFVLAFLSEKIFDYTTPLVLLVLVAIFFLISYLCTKKLKTKWVKYICFSVVLLGLIAYYIYNLYPETTYTDIEMGLEKPVKIVQLTDFHCNTTFPQIINYAVKQTNKEKPDMVVYTGDFKTSLTNGNPNNSVYEYFRKIKCRKIYAVLGNHDEFQNPIKVREKFEKANVVFADGKLIKIDSKTYLSGIDYKFLYFRNLRKSFGSLPKNKNIIYLVHNPSYLFEGYYRPELLKDKNIFFITGYTHGGQSLFPWTDRQKLAQERIFCDKLEGMVTCEGHKVWISRGIGTSYFPIRWNSRPQICVFNIK